MSPTPNTTPPTVANAAGGVVSPPARPLKVFYWAASLVDGTYRYRIEMPGAELARLGHEVQVHQRIGVWARDEADIIVGQRVSHPGSSILWREICRDRRDSGRGGTVFEVDDDLFDIDPKVNPLGGPFRRPEVQEALRANIRAAHVVTVSTEPLAAVVRKFRPGADPATVVVTPNAIRAETLAVTRTRPPARQVTLYGWQGSGTHGQDWAVARDAVAEILETTLSRLELLGHPYLDGLPVGTRGRIQFKPWTVDLGEHYRRVANFDVTLAPLANTKFNRSKSALRVQESLALGVPVVASDVPSYRGWVEDGVTGLVVPASTPKWADALRAMQDPARRAAMAAAGREAARAWTIERTIGRWVDAYQLAMEAT